VIASLRPRGCILTRVLAQIHDVTKESLGIWSGMVGHDWGGLRNLAEWGWSICNKGGTVPKSGDLALGMDHDIQFLGQVNLMF